MGRGACTDGTEMGATEIGAITTLLELGLMKTGRLG